MRCVTLGKILGTRVDKKCARLDKKSREGEKVRVWAKKGERLAPAPRWGCISFSVFTFSPGLSGRMSGFNWILKFLGLVLYYSYQRFHGTSRIFRLLIQRLMVRQANSPHTYIVDEEAPYVPPNQPAGVNDQAVQPVDAEAPDQQGQLRRSSRVCKWRFNNNRWYACLENRSKLKIWESLKNCNFENPWNLLVYSCFNHRLDHVTIHVNIYI